MRDNCTTSGTTTRRHTLIPFRTQLGSISTYHILQTPVECFVVSVELLQPALPPPPPLCPTQPLSLQRMNVPLHQHQHHQHHNHHHYYYNNLFSPHPNTTPIIINNNNNSVTATLVTSYQFSIVNPQQLPPNHHWDATTANQCSILLRGFTVLNAIDNTLVILSDSPAETLDFTIISPSQILQVAPTGSLFHFGTV